MCEPARRKSQGSRPRWRTPPVRFAYAFGALFAALTASLAFAQASPAIAAFSAPMVLHGGSDRRTENACSRSYAHGTSELRSELTVAADGGVVLEVTASSRSFMGPGRYTDGERGVSETGHAIHAVLRGRAALTSDTMTIDFVDADVASAYWAGAGTLPLGPPVTGPFVRTLVCARETRAVLPAGPSVPGEVAHDRAIARCTWTTTTPTELLPFADSDLYFGAGRGVIEYFETSIFHVGPAITFRLGS
jgi:hypothetical protein